MSMKKQSNISHTPVSEWIKLINSDLNRNEARQGLKAIVNERPPMLAEIILEGYCPYKCSHCIYPPDYHLRNATLSVNDWGNVLEHLYRNFHFRSFVFSGRSMTSASLSVIEHFKKKYSDVQAGVIGDGPSFAYFLNRLDIFDWVDISLDGWGETHDRQRNMPGSFEETLAVLRKIKSSKKVRRTSILSCLTTTNKESVIEMVQRLNMEGFKNFFVSPVHISENGLPDPKLKLSPPDFAEFAAAWYNLSEKLGQSWLSLDMYEHYYCQALLDHAPDLFSHLVPQEISFDAVNRNGDAEIHLAYFPLSLNLLHEFIVNCDGRIILPMVSAYGAIPENCSFGSVVGRQNIEEFLNVGLNTDAFDFFLEAFIQERRVLKNVWQNNIMNK